MTSPISSTAGNQTHCCLAIETSGSKGSLAIGAVEVQWEKKAIHSEIATLQLQKLLKLAGAELASVKKIVVNAGPGSFTGIRVGINLARTLAYSLDLPIAAFNALELLAGKHSTAGASTFVAIKAIQNFYYCAGFSITQEGFDQRLAPCSLAEHAIGNASANYSKVLVEGLTEGFCPELKAADMLQALVRWPKFNNFSTWREIQPVYIRASEAEEKLLKGLLKT